MLPFYRAWLAPQQIAVPVVAAVNGPAVGAATKDIHKGVQARREHRAPTFDGD
jgi:hypothetical protein